MFSLIISSLLQISIVSLWLNSPVFATSPPSSISLIFPASSEVPFNTTFSVGFSDPPNSPENIGLVRIVNISHTLPNGTTEQDIAVYGVVRHILGQPMPVF
ncbi:hypothetical protein VKT23_011575 [Stygiomarasmius scandens]|uniref:Uncharacterized protein n=1 Tax=Marasmiellus scandens TaxID=2682957 RepID=A0ABR1JBZ0_9AGAR